MQVITSSSSSSPFSCVCSFCCFLSCCAASASCIFADCGVSGTSCSGWRKCLEEERVEIELAYNLDIFFFFFDLQICRGFQ